MARAQALPVTPPPVAAPVTIYIVEDDSVISRSVREMLEGDATQIEEFQSGEEFLQAYAPDKQGCLLVDAGLPGMSGLDVLKRLGATGHKLPAIMITGNSDVELAVAAMKAGAVDFIEKPVGRTELRACVKRALDRARDGSSVGAEQAAAMAIIESLSKRQREVMDLVLAGHPNKNIAADLGLSQRTVENHRAAVMRRTNTKSLPALVRLAIVGTPVEKAPTDARRPAAVETMLATPELSDALESDQFRRFLDQVPLAIVVSTMEPPERIVYANPAFEDLLRQPLDEIIQKPWSALRPHGVGNDPSSALGAAITESADFVGSFPVGPPEVDPTIVDVYSNVIEDEDGTPTFRLAALVGTSADGAAQRQEFEQRIREKDMLLREIQHRVKNNLQMITALIRIEARAAQGRIETTPFDRLAGRIESIQIVYKLLSDLGDGDEIDLGLYLSEIATSVLRVHAVEGIRLDLKVDSYPVSVNVAMPTGLVVNELLMNALKHAFVGRKRGTITLHSLSENGGCRVVIADDGVGLPAGVEWPKRGKLGELIVRSLRQNAKADLAFESSPRHGTRVIINFTRVASAPDTTA